MDDGSQRFTHQLGGALDIGVPSPDLTSGGAAPPIIVRTRLLNAIQQPGLAPLTLIAAGAGYGKTSLARSWAQQADRPVAWVNITTAENDPWVLARRMMDAIQRLGAVNSGDDDEAMEPIGRPVDPASLPMLIAGLQGEFCLVLDDCDGIRNTQVTAMLDAVVRQLPSGGALMLISRAPLPLRLARLRALGQMREIDQDDLCFTIDETSQMLRVPDAEPVDEGIAWQIWNETQGWAVGIALAKVARNHAATGDLLSDVHRAQWRRYVDDYVLEEIVGPLPVHLQDFMLRTADLPYLSNDLCQATLGDQDGCVDIGSFVQEVAFAELRASDGRRAHYHPLVGSSLLRLARARYHDEERQARQFRAVNYLLDQGDVRAAARLVLQSADSTWARELIVQICRRLADRSDFDQLLELLGEVPASLREKHPSLEYWRIVARLAQRQTEGIAEDLDASEEVIREVGQALGGGRIALCRGFLAYHQQHVTAAEARLQEALGQLPADATVERLYAHTMLGQLDLDSGRDTDAAVHLAEANACAALLPLDEQWTWRSIGAERGNTYAFRGDLQSAITKYQLMIDELPPALSHLEGVLRCRLVSLWIERDDLERADAELKRAEALRGEHAGAWHHKVVIAKVRLLLAKGDREGAGHWAANYLKYVRRLPEKNQLVLLLARIWLSRGEFSLVRHWLSDMETVSTVDVRFFGDISRALISIEADLAQQRYADALVRSRQLAAQAEATLRWSIYIQATMRSAVALFHLGEYESSQVAVRAAMERGLPGGFVRSFLVPGFDTMSMFADLWQGSRDAVEVRQRLRQIEERARGDEATALTSREREILQRVASGETNKDIADALFISANTVRNHLVKVFSRLDARTRSEAVAKARELDLLS